MDSDSPPLLVEIIRPTAPLLEAALRLALGPLAAEDRQASIDRWRAAQAPRPAAREIPSAVEAQPERPELFAALNAGRIVGALWTESQPGRTVVFSRPQLAQGVGPDVAVALLRAAAEQAIASKAVLLEALLERDARDAVEQFLSAGFEHACDLLYMVAEASAFPAMARDPAPELEFAAIGPDDEARLAEIVDRTYQDTLDCPRLNQVRSAAEVLEGYKAIGEFSRERWFLVRRDARDIGCLLLADHPQTNQWELVYMGLAPEARGRGWGVAITRHAQRLARLSGRERMVLAVDASNGPAVAMYERAGLFAWDRRSVLLRVLLGS